MKIMSGFLSPEYCRRMKCLIPDELGFVSLPALNLMFVCLQLEGQVVALLVQNMERLDEQVKEEADGIYNTLGKDIYYY